MNSKSIKKLHNKKYRDFYSKNTLVISLPLLLNWSSDVFTNYKWLFIKQKIPFRIYLWINKIEEKEIKLSRISYFDINEERFITAQLREYAPFLDEYYTYFNKKYKNNVGEKWGIEITILSEVSRWMWLSFMSIIGFLFILWLEVFYNSFKYVNTSEIDINNFLNSNNQIDKLFRKIIELNKDLWDRFYIQDYISSFFDSNYPIISFMEEIIWNIKDIDVSKLNIYGYRLDSLEKSLSNTPFIPIDYGLVYSWKPVLIDHIENTNEDSHKWSFEVKEKLNKYFWPDIDWLFPNQKPAFFKIFIQEENNIFKETYGKLMWAISLELFNCMIKLYSNSYTESWVWNFILAINKFRYGNYITRKSSSSFNTFMAWLYINFNSIIKNLGIMPNDTSVMWWNVVFAMPYEWFRKEFFNSLDKLKINNPQSKLVYTNWLDWIETRWFILEQDIENNHYSEFIGKNSLLINSNKTISKIIDQSGFNISDLSWLTLDLINKKIYLDWVKLTSRDIHSQNTTIDLLDYLMKNLWKEIKNNKLSSSSYTTNKNEMTWKIIQPLIKIIEDRKNIKFPLTCVWTFSDFYVKLEQSNLEINIIRKLV